MSEMREVQGFCSICVSRCGTINTVVDDMLVNVRADPQHPNGKAICMKGRAAPELAHHPDRLLYPMRRTTPKGATDPGWKRISWDDALSEIAEKLNQVRLESGAEALVVGSTTPSGSMGDSFEWVKRFAQVFGTPNFLGTTEICNWHKDDANIFTFGVPTPPADYRNAEVILLWGHNPTNTWLAQADAIGQGRSAGAKLVVVDPRPTQLARQADLWLRVRPGTDAVLAMGIARAMIEAGSIDVEFVRQWTNAPLLVRSDNGRLLRERDIFPQAFEDRFAVWNMESGCVEFHASTPGFTPSNAAVEGVYSISLHSGQEVSKIGCSPVWAYFKRAVGQCTPRMVEEITGITERDLLRAVFFLKPGQRISHFAWSGVGQHVDATQTARAIATLYALTGAFDRKGANWVLQTLSVNRIDDYFSLVAPEQREKVLGFDARPLGPASKGVISFSSLCDSLLGEANYKVRALLTFGLSPHTSNIDPPRIDRALQSLEFHVHCDLFETPASRHADFLLPVCSLAEREALRVGFEISEHAVEHVQIRPRLISPRGECKADYQIALDLAARLGMGDAFFNGDIVSGWDFILEPLGLDVATLRKKPGGVRLPIQQVEKKFAVADREGGFRGFATQTGRVELYSEKLLVAGYDPLPSFRHPPLFGTNRHQEADYPYVLTSAKNGYYCHSQHRNLASLRKRSPYPLVELSMQLGQLKGIQDGDWVRIVTKSGSARFKAKLVEEMAFEVLVAEYGWWQSSDNAGFGSLPLLGPRNSNFSNLLDGCVLDPISGSAALRSAECNVELDSSSQPRAWNGFRDFRVVELNEEAEGVRTVRFETLDAGVVPDYFPGQHITCKFPAFGEAVRSYSLIGPARHEGRNSYSISVRLVRRIAEDGEVIEGAVSGHIHRELRVGDTVSIKAPNGVFTIPIRAKQPIVLFAGGIGITPFISYLETLAKEEFCPDVFLFYGNRNWRTHAFRDRIDQLSRSMPSLTVANVYYVTSPNDPSGTAIGPLAAGVVSEELVQARARFYFCGPEPMMAALRDQLIARGVPPFDIFKEAFRSPSVPDFKDGEKFLVHFKRSGKVVEWSAAAGSLLSLGEKNHVQLSSGCRVGQCESCAVQVLSGTVAHISGEGPEESQMCLACQAIPTSELILDA